MPFLQFFCRLMLASKHEATNATPPNPPMVRPSVGGSNHRDPPLKVAPGKNSYLGSNYFNSDTNAAAAGAASATAAATAASAACL